MAESVFAERIVQNLLDTDFYKLTMMQAVLHNYPNAEVEWEFRCRNSEDLTPYLAEIRFQIDDTFDRLDGTRALFARPDVQRDISRRDDDDGDYDAGEDRPRDEEE